MNSEQDQKGPALASVSEGSVSEGSVSEGGFSEGGVSEVSVSKGSVSKGSASKGGASKGSVFEGSVFEGRVFEDFEIGAIYRHPLGRTILSADNSWFTQLTLNPNPIHFDHAYAAKTEWGRPLVNSTFVLALVTGLSVSDLSRNAVNLGWDEVRLPHPVFEGDTLYAQSEVLELRPSRSRPHQGVARFRTIGFNQDGVVVIEYQRTILVYRRGHLPEPPSRPEPKLP